MKTLLELTYRVLNPALYRINKDQLPREDEAINAIISGRARIIVEGYQKSDAINLTQKIAVTEITQVKSFVVDGHTILNPHNLFEANIPTLIDGLAWENIQYLGSSSYGPKGSLRRIGLSGFATQNHNQWTGHLPCYTYLPGKLYLKNLGGVGSIVGYIIAADPREVPGFTEDGPFPLPERLVDRLVISVQRELFGDLIPKPDLSQNQIDEILTQQKQNG